MNEVVKDNQKNNITEWNYLLHAAAYVVTERLRMIMERNPSKTRIDRSIEIWSKDLSKIKEI